MNGQRPNGQRRPAQRPQNTRPNPQRRPAQRPQDINDALNERYEEMVAPGSRADGINRGKYADLSAFESRGHRKIDPAVMRAKKRKELLRRYIPVAAVALAAVIALWVYFGFMLPASRYDEAIAFFEKGDYSSAGKLFGRLDDYKDSGDYITYIDGREAYKNGDYTGAKLIFDSLGDFYDSMEMALSADAKLNADRQKASDYAAALELLQSGDYAAAKEAFEALEPYKDSAEKATLARNELDYAEAMRLIGTGDTDGAREILLSLGSFRDSAQRLAALGEVDVPPADDSADRYAAALSAVEEGDYRTANNLFNELGDYSDSKRYADYTYARMCYNNGDWGTAVACFEACGGLLDSGDLLYDARYNYAIELYRTQDESRLPEVIGLFAALGDYSDSADMLYAAKEQYKNVAVFAYYDGDLERALGIFESLSGHSECDEWAEKIRNELA